VEKKTRVGRGERHRRTNTTGNRRGSTEVGIMDDLRASLNAVLLRSMLGQFGENTWDAKFRCGDDPVPRYFKERSVGNGNREA